MISAKRKAPKSLSSSLHATLSLYEVKCEYNHSLATAKILKNDSYINAF